MSASIATAILAIVSGGVAGPAVFQVMTRMLASVFAGSGSVPRPPRADSTATFATVAMPATSASDRANARIGRAIARSSASSGGSGEREREDAAERHDLSDRVDALDAEEPGEGEHRCGDRAQHGHEDPEQAKHDGDSMRAGCEIGQRTRACARASASRYPRRMPGSQRFEGPSDLHLHSAELRRHGAPGRGDGGGAPARGAHGRADRPRHDVGVGRGGGCGDVARHDVRPRHGAVGAPRVAERPRAGVPLRSRRTRRCVPRPTRIRSSRLDRARLMADRIARDYDLVWDDIVEQTDRRRDRRPPAHRRRPRGARPRARSRGGVRRHPESRRRLLRGALRPRSGDRRGARRRRRGSARSSPIPRAARGCCRSG